MKFYERKIKLLIKYLLFSILIVGWIFSGWPQIFNFPPEIQEAKAAVADVGIWRDSAGAQIPSTTFAAMNFATQERNDGAYTFTGSNNLNLDEAGNYLLIATLKFDDSSNGRVNYEGRFTYTGTGNFVTLYGTGYSRNNNNRTAWVRVVGLVWGAAVNDDVQLETRRDTDTPIGGSVADASHFQVVRLHDSAAVGLYTDTSDTGAYGTQTWTDAPYNNIVLENDTTVIQKQAGDVDFRLKKDATTFLVGYGMAFGTGGSRTQRVSRMVAGTTGIAQSYSYAYIRNASNEYGDPNGLFLYRNSGTSTDLSVQVQRGSADVAGSAVRRTSTSGMFVVELPASAEVFISHDGTGGQDVGGTNGDYNLMRSADIDYNDAAAFTRSTDTAMNSEKAMDILLTASAYVDRSTDQTSNARMTSGMRFKIQAVNQSVGEHGNYMRGNQSSQDTWNYASYAAGLFSVSSGDDVQVDFFDAGDNGLNDLTVANQVGFSALNLDSLTSAVVSVSVSDGVVTYGTIPANTTKSTCTSELNDAQIVTNNGNTTENFNIRGQNSANWTLVSTAGSDTYVHKFLNGACSTFSGGTALTTSDQAFATGVAQSGTATLNLQINTPNPSTVYTGQSVDVIITAVQG